jgi:hypothetical protein
MTVLPIRYILQQPGKAGIWIEKTGFRISMRVFAESRYDKSGMTKSIKLMSESVDIFYALDDRWMRIVKCGIEWVWMEV